MVVIRLLTFTLVMLAVPAIVGGLMISVDNSLPFRWVSGQFLLWAGFQVICVPMVLAKRRFSELVVVFSGFMASMVLFALAAGIRCRAKTVFGVGKTEKPGEKGM